MGEEDEAFNRERQVTGRSDWLRGGVGAVWRVDGRMQRTNQVLPQQQLNILQHVTEVQILH